MDPKVEIREILADCVGNTKRTAETLFPEVFNRPWTGLHHRIFDLIDNSDNPRKAIIAPRGIGKTTITNLLLPAKAILFFEHPYIVPISCTSSAAEQQSENLKFRLQNSEMVRKIFGDLSTSIFNKQEWVAKVGGHDGAEVYVRPRGAGQQVRGQNWRGRRPSLIIPDDLEDPENMDNEELRVKKKDWFWNDVMESVDIYEKPITWQIILVNTLLHEDSLAADIINNPDWDVLELEICNDDLKSNIPEWWSDEDIKNKYDEKARQGNIEGFFREFRNKPNVTGDEAPFPKSSFKYYNPSDIDFSNKDFVSFGIIDPARTANPKSAKSACIFLSINPNTQKVYIRDVINQQFHVDEFYDEVFSFSEMLGINILGVEVTGLGEYALYPVMDEMNKRNLMMRIEELHAKGGTNEKGKKARVRGLSKYYRSGSIYHPDTGVAQGLESQLLSFPNSKYWDAMDALGYLPEMLSRLNIFMDPKINYDNLLGDDEEDLSSVSDISPRQMLAEMRMLVSDYDDEDMEPITNMFI